MQLPISTTELLIAFGDRSLVYIWAMVVLVLVLVLDGIFDIFGGHDG